MVAHFYYNIAKIWKMSAGKSLSLRIWWQYQLPDGRGMVLGMAYDNTDYLAIWQKLDADPTGFEVLRNLPLQYPLSWVNLTPAD